MSYSAIAVANFFIQEAKKEGDKKLDLMKLQKLIYLAHGWSLALLDRPLVDRPIEAWRYGPVIPDVYFSLKHFGMEPIDHTLDDVVVDDKGEVKLAPYNEDIFDLETKALLNQISQIYRDNTGIQLSNWSHDPKGPWAEAWEKGTFPRLNIKIPNERIKEYFNSLRNPA